ncbi:hypothetical protein QBC39DRAFT_361944 [Podospora conica]|nr:hypothetical protein QBC39DRAFT_361944 [Schizothecium conicum]
MATRWFLTARTWSFFACSGVSCSPRLRQPPTSDLRRRPGSSSSTVDPAASTQLVPGSEHKQTLHPGTWMSSSTSLCRPVSAFAVNPELR